MTRNPAQADGLRYQGKNRSAEGWRRRATSNDSTENYNAHAILALLLSSVFLATVVLTAEPERAAVPTSQKVLTGKERLSDKASDEQRVDDCKVAPGRRIRARPTTCPWDVGS